MTKEDIYDNQINPLMKQIIDICKEHKIAMLADFALDGVDFHCTSAVLWKDCEPLDNQLKAFELLRPRRHAVLAETIETRPDGSKHVSIRRIS